MLKRKDLVMIYTMEIAGKQCDLKLFPVNDDMQIAAFVLFHEVELTQLAAKELLARAPEFDLIFTAEAKSIPLAYEMARQAGLNNYIIARKALKVYMEDAMSINVKSITTSKEQKLFLSKDEVELMRGKRILIIDDVISTGESLRALEELATKAGGQIVGRMAVLAEGEAFDRDDIIVLGKLPLFDGDGNPM